MLNNSPLSSNKDSEIPNDIVIEFEEVENLRSLLTQIEMEENAEGGLETIVKLGVIRSPKRFMST